MNRTHREQYPIVNSTRVKICGITRVEDARAAAAAGADAIGLVFYPKSSRYVESSAAANIARVVGPFVTVVGLFVNATVEDVRSTLSDVDLALLQFHGDEDETYCKQFGRPYIKAIRMEPGLDVAEAMSQYPSASGFLFDAWNKDKYGGTGETFEWNRLPHLNDLPCSNNSALILAGGLTPDNIAEAVAATKPYAVDVSGGVEITPGIKSEQLIQQFIARATAG
ncbi:MAG: phosphoribosylanthranilate isomerase [Porticoccus sp.]|nr:phosphoribosylanthranilate isomerase [Porticoccus sp.]